MKRKSEKRQRDHVLTIRVAADELEQIRKTAKLHGLSVSELVRRRALHEAKPLAGGFTTAGITTSSARTGLILNSSWSSLPNAS